MILRYFLNIYKYLCESATIIFYKYAYTENLCFNSVSNILLIRCAKFGCFFPMIAGYMDAKFIHACSKILIALYVVFSLLFFLLND